MKITFEASNPEYREKAMTKEGRAMFTNLLEYYVEMWFKQGSYPFKIGLILGIPNFETMKVVNSSEALYERIIVHCMLLSIYKINIEHDNGTITT